MKISKRTREQAWLICALLASDKEQCGRSDGPFFQAVDAADATEDEQRLACDAFHYVRARVTFDDHGFHRVSCSECGRPVACGSLYYAEAAALLAEGWCPP